MDLVTQAIAGSSIAQAFTPKGEHRRAAWIGCIAGIMPDIDALIRSSEDPLLELEYHRHFTHAFIFIPVIAMAVTLLLRPFLKGRISFRCLYRISFLGVLPGGLLDACTSYGTHLFWPFLSDPVSLNIIAIVDPVLTAVLFVPLIIGLYRDRPTRIGIVLAGAYLLFGWVQQERAERAVDDWINERKHQPTQRILKPTMANLFLWRSLYQFGDSIYVDAIRIGDREVRYQGDVVERFVPKADAFLVDLSLKAIHDVERFSRFALGWVVRVKGGDFGIGDVRYSMVPNSSEPMWGFIFEREGLHMRTRWFARRSLSTEVRKNFIRMLLGVPISAK